MSSDHEDNGDREEPRRRDDYEVGRNRPPKQTRFRKGKSGNPKGRPKGSLNIKTEIIDVLSDTIPINENGKKKRVTRHKAMILRNVAQAINGDQRAYANVLKTVDKYAGDEIKKNPEPEPSEAQKQTLQNYRDRLEAELREKIKEELLAEMSERGRRD